MNYSDVYTEKELQKLEKKLRKMYGQAWKELDDKCKKYFSDMERKYKQKLKQVENGTLSEEQLNIWYRNQVGTGKRWETLRDQMADRMTSSNEIAASYINDSTPGIYSINHNFSLYQIASALSNSNGVSTGRTFTLVNENAIKRLVQGKNQSEFKVYDNGVAKYRKNIIDRKADYKWNSKRISNALSQGILQGDGPKEMSKRFYGVMESNYSAAIRNARTSYTSAQNGGRLDSYYKSAEMGIQVRKEWVSTHDKRTRSWHGAMDGETVNYDEQFSNGMMYPGDPAGLPEDVYNCRCRMIPIYPGINDDMNRKGYDDWMKEQEEINE